jgi:hypothetical protein
VGGISLGAVLAPATPRSSPPPAARSGRQRGLAPKALGSDFNFLKGFTHVSITLPFSRSFFWAQGYRVGLGQAFGVDGHLPSFERFTAGGTSSVRGFGTIHWDRSTTSSSAAATPWW